MKNKFLITGLATATLLSTAALTQLSPTVYATTTQPSAEEKANQDKILANFDKALAETIKELEEEAKNDPDSAESIKETIAKLKAEAAKERAKIEDGFKTGKTAEATEGEIEEVAKAEEEKEKAEAEAEEAAQKEFLANFDKALEDAIAELKKADTQNDPELAKKVEDAITKLKEEAAKQKKEIEDGFNSGLTVEEAEKLIDDANKKAAEEAKAKQDEFLANYDKALEDAVKELEKAETNSPEEVKAKADTIAALKAASDATRKQIVEGFEKGLTVEEAEKLIDELNKKAAEEDKEAAAKEKAAQDEFLANYDKALEEAVKELEKAETNSPEEAKAKADTIAALKAASDKTRAEIVEGFKKGLTAKQAEALIDELNKKAAEEANKPAEQPKAEKGEALVQPVLPEFDLSKLNKYPTPNPEPTPGTPAPKEEQKAPSNNNPAGINPRTSANSAQAATEEKTAVAQAVAETPKAEESKQAKLPNTGSAEFAVFTPAVLSILAGLGLVAPKGKKEDK